jgi:hypothetical protein
MAVIQSQNQSVPFAVSISNGSKKIRHVMLRKGALEGNRIDWSGEAPTPDQPLRVHVTVLDEENASEDRGRRMAGALSRLAESGAFAEIDDPSEWQRKVRRERSLLEREAE